jgi:hypothetical protein
VTIIYKFILSYFSLCILLRSLRNLRALCVQKKSPY